MSIIIAIKVRFWYFLFVESAVQEKELIAKIGAGDHTAFKVLFDTYKSAIFNVCFRMLGNRQEAEDITQDVFFQVYKSASRFRFESKLSFWLYRIAVNLCLNHQKKKKRAQWFSLDDLLESSKEKIKDTPASTDNRPDVLFEKSEKEFIVQQAINSLPKQQRVAVILHRHEGLSYQEIAKVMACSVASVESRLHRAKVRLAKKLLSQRQEI